MTTQNHVLHTWFYYVIVPELAAHIDSWVDQQHFARARSKCKHGPGSTTTALPPLVMTRLHAAETNRKEETEISLNEFNLADSYIVPESLLSQLTSALFYRHGTQVHTN